MSATRTSADPDRAERSASRTLVTAIAVAALTYLLLTAVLVVAYNRVAVGAREHATENLQRVAEKNATLIAYWYAEREADIHVIGSASRVRTEFEQFLQGDERADTWLRFRLEAERSARNYTNVTLYDTSGKARMVLGAESPGHAHELTRYALEAAKLTTGTVMASHPAEDGSYHVVWFAPLRVDETVGRERTTGVVMFESDLKSFLQRVIAPVDNPWPTMIAMEFQTQGYTYVADASDEFSFRLVPTEPYPGAGTIVATAPIDEGKTAVVSWMMRKDLEDSLRWERWSTVGVDLLALVTLVLFVAAYERSDRNRRKELLAKEALQEALTTQDRFLTNVSHDLRTPLNSIIGFAGLLKQGMPGPLNAEQFRQVSMIEASGKHLLALVSDILDLTKPKVGAEEVDPETLLARDLVDYVTERLAPLVAEKGLTWETDVPDDLELITDRHLAQRVLLNLGANAVKFTVNGGVTITVKRRAGNLIAFAVRDTGPGLEYGTHREIMREFRQLHRPGDTKPDGAGLGLPISSKTAAVLGGEIEVDSTPGEGATFTFVLPADGAVS
ncbi:MAG: HAMP domain-containing histidine kinase [Actinobacteria bacterium]|nr:MAG: HAMP domain-containing histidine kinase [Actinomycetota bacterium]